MDERERMRAMERREIARKVYKMGFGFGSLRVDETREREGHWCWCCDGGAEPGFCILGVYAFFFYHLLA